MNVIKVFKEAIQLNDQTDSRLTALRDADINLNNVELKVLDCTWTDFSQESREYCSTVESSTADAKVKVPNEDETFIKVTIKNGIITGLNKPMKLPMDEKRSDLIKDLGSHIKIDPSKPESEPVHKIIKSEGAVKGTAGAGGAIARVCIQDKEYRGSFNCKVIMKGYGLASGIMQPIADAIENLKPKNPDLKDLTVRMHEGEKVVQFTMEGELNCKWGTKHRFEMK